MAAETLSLLFHTLLLLQLASYSNATTGEDPGEVDWEASYLPFFSLLTSLFVRTVQLALYSRVIRDCPRQQHINNTVCFWPREKFISTSEDTKYKSGKIKRNRPLCHQKPGQKPTVSRKDPKKKRREIRRLHMNNSLLQLIRKCKLRF